MRIFFLLQLSRVANSLCCLFQLLGSQDFRVPGFTLLHLQSSQPLPRIFYLSDTRVSVLPEVEEFLVMLDGLG